MDQPSSTHSPSLLALVAAVLLCVGLSTTLAQHLSLPWSLAVAEGGLLPPLLWWQWSLVRGTVHRPTLQSRLVLHGVRLVGAGLLLGAVGAVVLGMWVHPWVARWMTPTETQQLWSWIKPTTGWRPLWVDVLCWAVVPACAEELLWRGLLLHATRSRACCPLSERGGEKERPAARGATKSHAEAWRRGGTTRCGADLLFHDGREWTTRPNTRQQTLLLWLITSVLFAVLHGSWARVVPTLLLGLWLGAAALRSRSLLLCVVAHGMYNGGVLLLTRSGVDLAQLPVSSRLVITAVAIGLGSWTMNLLRYNQSSAKL